MNCSYFACIHLKFRLVDIITSNTLGGVLSESATAHNDSVDTAPTPMPNEPRTKERQENNEHAACLTSSRPCSECLSEMEKELAHEEAVKWGSPTASEVDFHEEREVCYQAHLQNEYDQLQPRKYGWYYNNYCNCRAEYGPLGNDYEYDDVHLNPQCPFNSFAW